MNQSGWLANINDLIKSTYRILINFYIQKGFNKPPIQDLIPILNHVDISMRFIKSFDGGIYDPMDTYKAPDTHIILIFKCFYGNYKLLL
jgi:hypothetical protein